jgi:hydrogenase maturation protein HypF
VTSLRAQRLPRPAAARVLACGAFLKNSACLIDGDVAWWSPLHGDLSDPAACAALEASLHALLDRASGPLVAVAHDLHPDFHSTRVAQALAQRLGVPAVAVQHHHAHVAVVQAEHGLRDEGLLGLALDGVGLGDDGLAWGGEVLHVAGAHCQRLQHLPLLALPGGDVAAREPWRLAAAVLHRLGRGDQIVPRLAPQVGEPLARGVAQMLARDLNCPRSSSAGRWFDAAAGVLGLSLRQTHEAQAAQALERAATGWLAQHSVDSLPQSMLPEAAAAPSLDLAPLLGELFDEAEHGRGAARFHLALAGGLVQAVTAQARALALQMPPTKPEGTRVALTGGCFYNRLLDRWVADGLNAEGLRVLRPQQAGCGDAGLALGQAWAAALRCTTRAPNFTSTSTPPSTPTSTNGEPAPRRPAELEN